MGRLATFVMINGVVLTYSEAVSRTALLDVESYDVFLDLSGAPARSRTEATPSPDSPKNGVQ